MEKQKMPFVIGGLAALVALAAGILAQVDPLTSLWRAALALALGWIGANLWYVFTTAGREIPQKQTLTEESPSEPIPS